MESRALQFRVQVVPSMYFRLERWQRGNRRDGISTAPYRRRNMSAGPHHSQHPHLNGSPFSAEKKTPPFEACLAAPRSKQASGEWYRSLGGSLQRIETLAQKCQHHDLVGSELGV